VAKGVKKQLGMAWDKINLVREREEISIRGS